MGVSVVCTKYRCGDDMMGREREERGDERKEVGEGEGEGNVRRCKVSTP